MFIAFKTFLQNSNTSKNISNVISLSRMLTAPFMVVISDMTAFCANGVYYELTLFMDLYNNEIIAYSLSNK